MAASLIRTETILTTLGDLNADFAGRIGTKDYDPTKRIHIHRRNRAFVWKMTMQQNFVDSLLKGYYIPPIICSCRLEGGKDVIEVMEGGNRITTLRRILLGLVTKPNGEELTEMDRLRVQSYRITLVIMRGLTSRDQRLMFGRLNKSIKVTDGHLYAMSEEDSPLVKEALALLNSPDYPLRARITSTFFDTVDADNAGKKNLENAVALVSGILNGVRYITKSFDRQEAMVEQQQPIDRSVVVERLTEILDVFRMADTETPLTDRRRLKAQWSVGKYLGAILYELLTTKDTTETVQKKWVNYIVRVRNGVANGEEAIEIMGAQNLTSDKLKRKCHKVDVFMRENRLATEMELIEVRHADAVDSTDESDEDEEGTLAD